MEGNNYKLSRDSSQKIEAFLVPFGSSGLLCYEDSVTDNWVALVRYEYWFAVVAPATRGVKANGHKVAELDKCIIACRG